MKNKFMQWFLSPGAYAVWCALAVPEEWSIDSHGLTHDKSHVQLWCRNGAMFLNGTNGTPKFMGLFERHVVWRRVRTMRNRMVFIALTKASLGVKK